MAITGADVEETGPMSHIPSRVAFAIVSAVALAVGPAAAGTRGAVRDQTTRLYEFAQPPPLDPTKALWGFRIEDSSPGLNWGT